MSAQLSLDSLGGIDWDHPTHEQLEQFAHDYLVACYTRLERRNSFMCVCVAMNWAEAWLRPSLERTADDRLEWVVRFEDGPQGRERSLVLRSDEELEAVLWSEFVAGYCE